ncbi:serine/threonine protein kinase [Geomicrobium sediminis]|uniref:Serine/threonine-protein kinase n=1 Tax=Geomicrobium sediminis TaxID=1347788 RepID=A0ABS2PIH1_9BACL|nr:serine/threonine protein kinase [Geomicrobium sediminis]MBM7635159.1 serine/threonine-protein kinase [Geomicrobium sediminis]
MIEHVVDDVRFHLHEKHDFRWIKKFGKVFAVYPDKNDGYLCFGINRNGVKRYIKYAGAKTALYFGKPEDAVEQLEKAKLRYEFLKHPSLVKLTHHEDVGPGYMLEYEWIEGENLWRYPFEKLELQERLQMLETIFTFHEKVEQKSFIAIGFNNASMIYDETNKRLKIINIDHYEKNEHINKMENVLPSSPFVSPEELTLNTKLNTRTNVYRMGAIAFSVLGKDQNLAGSPMHKVAKRAMSKDSTERFESVQDFHQIWKKAVEVSLAVQGY